jgi:acyl-CoA synthetase (AMP-forming)/AMP-acid ligase II/thioesterase domain-containing protein/acyl carrier protein
VLPFPIDPEKDTICDVFRRWSEVQPDAPALIEEGNAPLTYGTLVAGMDEIRGTLNSSGFGRGNRIAVVHSGGVDMAFILFGIMSGATAVPLDPRLTESEFKNNFRDRKVDALIIEPGVSKAAMVVAQGLGISVFEMHTRFLGGEKKVEITTQFGGEPVPPAMARSDDVAVVYGTSGTTGRSKIVPKKQRLFLVSYEIRSKCFGTGQDDVGILFRPMYYAGPFGTVAEALFGGGSVVVLPSFEPAAFFRCATTYGVTWITAGPTFHRAIHRHVREHSEAVQGVHIRQIRVSSAALEQKMVDELERIFSASIETSYGLTEGGRIAVSRKGLAPRKPGTVGVAIDRLGFGNAEIRIRSLEGVLLPPGVHGEVVIRGDQVIEGYENNPEANAEAFVDGWFRTGDEGFLDAGGYLTLTGRIKEMINRGGEKVSPAEVDAALMDHPEVREAATFPIPHATLGEEVAAAIVQEAGAGLTDQELTKYLLQTLTGFKVPRRFCFVDDIPKSETGKVQRYRLAAALGVAEATASGAPPGDSPDRPPTPLESRLQVLWAKALELPRVGLYDNFFLLGGDSLQAIDLFFGIEKEMKSRLPVAALFEAGTVAEMARMIEDGAPQGCIVPIQPHGDKPPFFCVHGARGGVIHFSTLAKHLAGDQPFYGIQSVGWDPSEPPFTRTADMAAHYVSEMRKIQPHGPYFLGGYSFGGRVAVYMANLLRRAGEEVALLALIDTTSHMGRRYVGFGQWLARIGAPPGPGRVGLALRYAGFRIHRAYRALLVWGCRLVLFPLRAFYRATGLPVPFFIFRPDRFNALVRVEHENMPPYEGDAIFFKTTIGPDSMSHPDTKDSWDQVIRGKLDVVPVPGTHETILQDSHAGPLAEELQRFLTKAQAGSNGAGCAW